MGPVNMHLRISVQASADVLLWWWRRLESDPWDQTLDVKLAPAVQSL